MGVAAALLVPEFYFGHVFGTAGDKVKPEHLGYCVDVKANVFDRSTYSIIFNSIRFKLVKKRLSFKADGTKEITLNSLNQM